MTFSAQATASYFALWALVLIQTLVLLELLRQIGILRQRIGPDPGALLTGEGLTRGSIAPDFTAVDLRANRSVTLEQFRGRVTLLVFLSPGCQACRELAPDLRRLSRDSADGAAIVVICSGSAEGCQAFAQEFRLDMPLIYDEGQEIAKAYQAQRTPSAAVIDAEGRVRIHGIPNSKEQLEGLLKEEGTPMLDRQWISVQDKEVTLSKAP